MHIRDVLVMHWVLITCFYCALLVAGVRALDAYGVLEVGQNASPHEIRQSYKKLAKQWHPDKNRSPEASKKFMEINEAYKILSNEMTRFRYDYFRAREPVYFEPVFDEPERSFYETTSTSWNSSLLTLIAGVAVIVAANYILQTATSSFTQKTEDASSGVPQLTHEKMNEMIINTDVPRICITVLVINRQTKAKTIQAFEQAIQGCHKDNRLWFTWFAAYENSNWLKIIEKTRKDCASGEMIVPLGNGSVVAFNGKKKYFSVLPGVDLYSNDQQQQRNSSELEDTFLLGATDVDDSLIGEYCKKVANWFDHLLDGNLKRHHVEQWPDIMKTL